MKLYFSPASPYVRKVTVVAHETGQFAGLELVTERSSPVNPNPEVAVANPLVKVPTLVPDAGPALFDSPVICEYLDSLHDGAKLFPAAGSARWLALRNQALADGILDAAILYRYEITLRPEALRWSDWLDGQMAKVNAAIALAARNEGHYGKLHRKRRPDGKRRRQRAAGVAHSAKHRLKEAIAVERGLKVAGKSRRRCGQPGHPAVAVLQHPVRTQRARVHRLSVPSVEDFSWRQHGKDVQRVVQLDWKYEVDGGAQDQVQSLQDALRLSGQKASYEFCWAIFQQNGFLLHDVLQHRTRAF